MTTDRASPVAATVACIAIVAVHAALLHRFTDESLFLTPDFVDYLIGARSLASGQGYRDLSDPNRPILTRPIGVPILLAPFVGGDGPFPIMLCKRWFNGLSIALCLAAGWFVAAIGGWRTGLCLAGLLALNPIVTTLGSNLYGEVPYALALVAMCRVLASANYSSSGSGDVLRFAVAACLALIAEKSRTMGLVLWPGLAIAAVAGGRNWRAAVVVVIAFAVSMTIDRLPMFGRPAASHYLDFYREIHRGQGVGSMFASIASAATAYLECAAGVVLPLLWPGLDWFAIRWRYVVPEWAAVAVGLGVVLVANWQSVRWIRSGRAALGWVSLIHFLGVAAALAIWPRMARLAFPLFVQCFALFWSNVFAWARRQAPALQRCLFVAVALLYFASTWLFWRDGVIPTGMWPQIKEAGLALAANPDPNLRIATDAKDLFLIAQRPQRFINASSQVMDDLNRMLLDCKANYYGFVGRTTDPKLRNNPTYTFRPVTQHAYGYSLLELQPNRSGSAQECNEQWNVRSMSANAADFSTPPGLLHEAVQRVLVQHDLDGRTKKAVDALRLALMGTRHSTPGATEAWLVLGLLEIEILEPASALVSFANAARCDYADAYAATIAGGRESAKYIEPLANPAAAIDPIAQPAIRERIAASLLASGRFRQSMAIADDILATAPRRLSAAALKFYALRRLSGPRLNGPMIDWAASQLDGRNPTELKEFQQPFEDLRFQIAGTRLAIALDGVHKSTFRLGSNNIEVDPTNPQAYTDLAQTMMRENLPGVALATLTKVGEETEPAKAAVRNDPQFWWTLAVLEDLYGRSANAERHAARSRMLDPNP